MPAVSRHSRRRIPRSRTCRLCERSGTGCCCGRRHTRDRRDRSGRSARRCRTACAAESVPIAASSGFSPNAPQCRLYAPVSESKTMTRWFWFCSPSDTRFRLARSVDAHLRRPRDVGRVVAAAAHSRAADLPQKFPCARKRKDVRVLLAVAGNPHTPVRIVDRDAMHLLRPVVAGPRAAPGLNDVACRVELDDRRRRHTARLFHGFAPVNDPDVIACVGRDSADRSDSPVIRKRLRPRRRRRRTLARRSARCACAIGPTEASGNARAQQR